MVNFPRNLVVPFPHLLSSLDLSEPFPSSASLPQLTTAAYNRSLLTTTTYIPPQLPYRHHLLITTPPQTTPSFSKCPPLKHPLPLHQGFKKFSRILRTSFAQHTNIISQLPRLRQACRHVIAWWSFAPKRATLSGKWGCRPTLSR